MSAAGFAPRAAAARLLSGVFVNRRMLSEQADALEGLAPGEKARAQSLAVAVLKHRTALDALIDAHLEVPPPLRIRQILRIAAWEMKGDGVASHAAVDMAVRVAKTGKKTQHLARLTNAVARAVANGPDLDATVEPVESGLRSGMVKAWGENEVAAMETAHAAVPPLDLTVKSDPEHWATTLGGALLPTGSIRLHNPGQVSALPGFDTGDWWVQDAAAALPVRLLGDIKGARVLDLCAAPGGKTMQLAAAGADVTALDASKARLARLEENMARTGLMADVITADAKNWSPSAPFDAILLDAPCSATGTIRRHPELPIVRRGVDLAPLLALQKTLLETALGWLQPGGRLVYCTCSLLPVEGERQVSDHPRAELPALEGIPAEWLATGDLRTRPDFWPDMGGCDGFFAACLQG